MIYLDYSATTPIDPRVAKRWLEVETHQFANANSTHALGQQSKAINDDSVRQIATFFNVPIESVIPTSSAVEANNFALKGLALRYPKKRHVIVSALEHASLIGAASYLAGQDVEVDTIPLTSEGLYDVEALETIIRPDTLVVSLTAVDSETGSRQPIEACALRCRSKGVFFHTDLTQLVGKGSFDLTNVDLATASAHKVYGPKGIGVLIKQPIVNLVPLLHGGHSVTPWRASTPPNGLLAAFAEALRLKQRNVWPSCTLVTINSSADLTQSLRSRSIRQPMPYRISLISRSLGRIPKKDCVISQIMDFASPRKVPAAVRKRNPSRCSPSPAVKP